MSYAILGATIGGFGLGFAICRLLGRHHQDEEAPLGSGLHITEVPAALVTIGANWLGMLLAWHAVRSWAILQAFKGWRAEYRVGLEDAKHLGAVAHEYPVAARSAISQEGRRA